MSAFAPTVLAHSRPTAQFVRAAIAPAGARVARAGWLARGVVAARSLGPYAAIELLLPGGTLIAFSLWLYRRHRQGKPVRPVIERRLNAVRLGAKRLMASIAQLFRSGEGLSASGTVAAVEGR